MMPLHGVGMPAPAAPATLEHFLATQAEVEQRGIAPVELEGEPILHYARRLDVLIWSLERY